MSNKKYFRCDDRLVHGQILYRWSEKYMLDNLIVIDDFAAQDVIERNIIKMSAPKKVNTSIFSIKDLHELNKFSGKTLVIFSELDIAKKLYQAGILKNELNIGRVSANVGKKKISEGIFISKEDFKLLDELDKNNIRIFSQMSPDDNLVELNKKLDIWERKI